MRANDSERKARPNFCLQIGRSRQATLVTSFGSARYCKLFSVHFWYAMASEPNDFHLKSGIEGRLSPMLRAFGFLIRSGRWPCRVAVLDFLVRVRSFVCPLGLSAIVMAVPWAMAQMVNPDS